MIRLLFALAALLFGVGALFSPLIEADSSMIYRHWERELGPAAREMPPGVPPLGTAPPNAYPPGTMFPPGTKFPPESYLRAAQRRGGLTPRPENHGAIGQTFPPQMFPPFTYLPANLFPPGTFPPDTNFFGGVAKPPSSAPAPTLWNYSPVTFGLGALALVLLAFCLAFNDRFLRGAAFSVALIFAGLTLYLAWQSWGSTRTQSSDMPLRWGFGLVLICALAGTATAFRREELPSLDDLFAHDAASAPGANRPNATRIERLTTPQMRVSLLALSVLALLGACLLPVIGVDGASGSRAPALSLFAYAPALAPAMLIPLALTIFGLNSQREELRRLGAGLGTLLTSGQLALIWRDVRDTKTDYLYGIFAANSIRTSDVIGAGFWLLGLASLCWFALNFDSFAPVANLPRTPPRSPSRAQPQREPLDFGALLQQFVASILTFGFCLSIFPLGLFLWRYFDEQDNRLAPVALAGWILGLVFWLGRFLLVGARALSG